MYLHNPYARQRAWKLVSRLGTPRSGGPAAREAGP
jgi:hypothetical protein